MIAVELTKQARRLRTYVALGVMVAIPVVITVATALDKGGGDNDPSPQAQLFRMITTSGLNVPLPALLAMSHFLLVVVVALFAAESHGAT